MFRYENSIKNKLIQTILGIGLGLINGILSLSLLLSILFYTIFPKEQLINKLNNSKIFRYIYTIKTTLVDYGK